jgi:hypothetical protein
MHCFRYDETRLHSAVQDLNCIRDKCYYRDGGGGGRGAEMRSRVSV